MVKNKQKLLDNMKIEIEIKEQKNTNRRNKLRKIALWDIFC